MKSSRISQFEQDNNLPHHRPAIRAESKIIKLSARIAGLIIWYLVSLAYLSSQIQGNSYKW